MAGIIGTIGQISKYIGIVKNSDSIESFNENLNKESRNLRLLNVNGSLTKLNSNLIVEPLLVVQSSLRTFDKIDKVQDITIDIFISYYLQGFMVLTQLYDIVPMDALELLSTDSSSIGSLKDVVQAGYGDGRRLMGREAKAPQDVEGFTSKFLQLDNTRNDNQALLNALAVEAKKKGTSDTSSKIDSFRLSDNSEITPTVVMRTLELDITVNGKGNTPKVLKLPVIVKAYVNYLSDQSILDMFADKGSDIAFQNRWFDYRAGVKTFAEMIGGGDIVAAYKKKRLSGDTDLEAFLSERRANSNRKLVRGGKSVGFERFYNNLIVDAYLLDRIEKATKSKMHKSKGKAEIINRIDALQVTVIDFDAERVIIHIKDTNGSSELSFRSLSKKGGNDDMMDIFKSLALNKSPVL